MSLQDAKINADSVHPVKFSRAVTPANTNIPLTRGLWVGGDGDIELMYLDGSIDTLKGVIGGTLLPIQVIQVRSATTATDISGLY